MMFESTKTYMDRQDTQEINIGCLVRKHEKIFTKTVKTNITMSLNYNLVIYCKNKKIWLTKSRLCV